MKDITDRLFNLRGDKLRKVVADSAGIWEITVGNLLSSYVDMENSVA